MVVTLLCMFHIFPNRLYDNKIKESRDFSSSILLRSYYNKILSYWFLYEEIYYVEIISAFYVFIQIKLMMITGKLY